MKYKFILIIFLIFFNIQPIFTKIYENELHLIEKIKFEELDAIQGLEFIKIDNQEYLIVANGYKNSIAVLKDLKIFSLVKVPNLTNEDHRPELFADVTFDGNSIFATSWRNGIVYSFDLNLKNKKEFFSYRRNFLGINFQNNKFFVAQDKTHEILLINNSGELIWKKQYLINDQVLTHPYGISYYDGLTYISFNRGYIIAVNESGDVIKSYLSRFEEIGKKITNLQSIVHDANGNLLALDTSNNRIIIFNNQLEPRAVLKYDGFTSPRGMTIDKKNNKLFVSDFYNKNIHIEQNTGIFIFDLNKSFYE